MEDKNSFFVGEDVAIHLNNVDKSYQDFQALKNVSFEVKKGQIFGFLGSNGSGKTSTIKLILGLITPSSGEVKLCGKSPLNKELKSKVGSLLEFNGLIANLTGMENLTFWGGLYDINKKEAIPKSWELLKLFKLSEWADVKVSNYSYGMQKRLGLARSLIQNPELIVLDEPTLGVDPETRQLIRKIIKKLANEGKTIFFSSHELDEVQKVCSHLAIVKNGEIIYKGSLNKFIGDYSKSELCINLNTIEEAKKLLSSIEKKFNAKRNGTLIRIEDIGDFNLEDYSDYNISNIYSNKSTLEESYFNINTEEV
ncbi:MAG: ABC transporter ATP-binding protein [Methanobrevibacter sp.]|jgi:ABC-2 type transport system ATP-binding protein|nr:ABC transporter ATP-binding protein [Candidatus Methanovirga basalitermitum]